MTEIQSTDDYYSRIVELSRSCAINFSSLTLEISLLFTPNSLPIHSPSLSDVLHHAVMIEDKFQKLRVLLALLCEQEDKSGK